MVTIYPDSEHALQSYHNIGAYHDQVGAAYHKLWVNAFPNPNSDDFNDGIRYYRVAYDFYKKAYKGGKQDSGNQLTYLITDVFVPNSTTYQAKRLIQEEVDYAGAIAIYDSVVSILIDMNNLISGSADGARATLENDLQDINIAGIGNIWLKIEVISDPNNNAAPLAYNDLASERLSLGNGLRGNYDIADSSDATNKREYFLLATNDYEVAYQYSKKAYQHSSASNEQREEAKEQIQQSTDALVNFCITHAGFLEQNNYHKSAINAYNIAVSHLKDVNALSSDISMDSINALPDGNWKSKLLGAVGRIP